MHKTNVISLQRAAVGMHKTYVISLQRAAVGMHKTYVISLQRAAVGMHCHNGEETISSWILKVKYPTEETIKDLISKKFECSMPVNQTEKHSVVIMAQCVCRY